MVSEMDGKRWIGGKAAGCLLACILAAVSGCQSVGMLAIDLTNTMALLGPFHEHRNIAYGPDPVQKLDLYVPEDGAKPAPVVVFFFGGNWTQGYPDKSIYRFVGDALTSKGLLVVAVNYRRYPMVKSPAFVRDGARAVVWVHRHIAAYGGDPDRIFLMGHSAGAQIATMLALNND